MPLGYVYDSLIFTQLPITLNVTFTTTSLFTSLPFLVLPHHNVPPNKTSSLTNVNKMCITTVSHYQLCHHAADPHAHYCIFFPQRGSAYKCHFPAVKPVLYPITYKRLCPSCEGASGCARESEVVVRGRGGEVGEVIKGGVLFDLDVERAGVSEVGKGERGE